MRVVENPEIIQALWEQFFAKIKHKNPFATFAWHINYLNNYKIQGKPLFFVDEELMVLAPLVDHENTIKFSGGQEISDYMDLVGNPDNFELMWSKLLPELKNLGHKSLDLFNVSESSPTLNFFTKLKEKSSEHVIIDREDTTPILQLSENFETYKHTLPHKQRHELERKLRKFDREHPGSHIEKSDDLPKSMERLLELMKFSERKKEFLTPENEAFFRLLPVTFPEAMIIYSVVIENISIASVVGFRHEDTFYLYNTGFNLHEFPGAGFVVQTHAIEQEIIAGTKYYNFLQGNERYKYDLGGKDKLVFRIQVELSAISGDLIIS